MTSNRCGATILLFAFGQLLCPAEGDAQVSATSPPAKDRTHLLRCAEDWDNGEKLRVTLRESSAARFTGKFAGLEGDSVVLFSTEDRLKTTPVPLSRIAYVEEPAGVRRHILAGALIGLGLGLAVGAMAAPHTTDGWDDLSRTEYGLVGAGVGLAVGAGLGYLIKTEQWVMGCRMIHTSPGQDR